MITTICLNPALDRTVTVESLKMGQVNRIRTSRTDVGGKGINVAVVCRRLGLDARVIGCAGVEGYAKIQAKAKEEKIGCHFHTVGGSVRVNTKVVPMDGSGVTELNESGPVLSAEDLDIFIDMAMDYARESDYVVLSGSLPPGCPPHMYRSLIEMFAPIPCILDVSGAPLIEGAKAKPFLIKPNHHELAATVGRKLEKLEEIREAAEQFLDVGIRHVVVSLGDAGALYVGEDGCHHAPAVPVAVRSTVGAGDSMVGGILYGLVKTGNMRDGLRAGIAAGTASVKTDGTELIHAEDFVHLLPEVQIREL